MYKTIVPMISELCVNCQEQSLKEITKTGVDLILFDDDIGFGYCRSCETAKMQKV